MTLLNQNDRISDLPSNVIDIILGNLKIQDLVSTSILSKNWRYMWTSTPQLCFDRDFYRRFLYLDDNPYAVMYKIMADVLMLHNGPIHKFTLDNGFPITMECLNKWIPILSRKNIKYLELVNYETVTNQMPYSVFSCKELTYFSFCGFQLSIPPNFRGFKRLLELHLYMVTFESGALDSLMSGCPFLEKLSIEYCSGCDYLDISSTTLKVLLLVLSNDIKSICFKKATNLLDFTLNAKLRISSDLIKSLPKIKRFSLSIWEKYEDTIPLTLLTSSFSSLEYLKLGDVDLEQRGELLHIVSVLKGAPRLIELFIEQSFKLDYTTLVLDDFKELECLSSCSLKLQTVNIGVRFNSQHAMRLIQFILANSPLLKTLTFIYISDKLHGRKMFRISQHLLMMERASPRAQINFLHSTYSSFLG